MTNMQTRLNYVPEKQIKFLKEKRKNASKDQQVDLSPIVKLFQETGNEQFFGIIMNAYRGRIQGRVYSTSAKYGIHQHDCESTLNESLWNAANTYNPEFGVPFDAYVSLKFNQDLTTFFNYECRHNKLFNPRTRSKEFADKDQTDNFTMVYTLSVANWDTYGDGDLSDPRVDVENFVIDQESAATLVESIANEIGDSYANVAVLTACGYTQREVAKAMDYDPEGVVTSEAQNMWVKRRLKKCIPPTMKHYDNLGLRIPITLRG